MPVRGQKGLQTWPIVAWAAPDCADGWPDVGSSLAGTQQPLRSRRLADVGSTHSLRGMRRWAQLSRKPRGTLASRICSREILGPAQPNGVVISGGKGLAKA